MKKQVKSADPSAEPSLRNLYAKLEEEDGKRRAADKKARASAAAAEESIRERVKKGETTGDLIADFYLIHGYSGMDPCAIQTRSLFKKVEAHPGQFFLLLDHTSKTDRHGGGVSGPQSDTEEFCLFGRIGNASCRMQEAKKHYIQIAVRIPAETCIRVEPFQYLSWRTPLSHVVRETPTDHLVVHNARTNDPSNWCSVASGDRGPWSSDSSRDVFHESTLLIGDEAVLKHFGIVDPTSSEEVPHPKDARPLKLLWLATAIHDPMDRSPLIQETAATARKTIAEMLRNNASSIDATTLKQDPKKKESLGWLVQLMKYYNLENEPFFLQAQTLLNSI